MLFGLSCVCSPGQPPQECVCSLMGLGHLQTTEILSRAPQPPEILSRAQGAMWRGLALQQQGSFPWAEIPESEVRSGLRSLFLPPTVKQRIRDTSSAQRTQTATGQREQGLGTIPIPSSLPAIAGEQLSEWPSSPVRSQPRLPLGLWSGGVAGDKDA